MSIHNLDVLLKTEPSGEMPGRISAQTQAVMSHLRDTAVAIETTMITQYSQIDEAIRLIRNCYNSGGKVLVAGNGGSSSTAAHFVNDAVKATNVQAVDLMGNTALLSAYSNDVSYQAALSQIAGAVMDIDDILLLISVSGDSPNIVTLADRYAWGNYPKPIIGLGSQRRGRLAELSTVFIEAQSSDMMISESVHAAVCHAAIAGLKA